jgi:Flp pilus assembly protein TadD
MNRSMINVLRFGAVGVSLAALSACGGPQIDRSGWECWEEMPCEAGFLCAVDHMCVPEIQDIPGVNAAALGEFNRGIVAMNQSPPNYEEALARFSAAREVDEDFWEAYENQGLLQMDLGMYREAAATFESEAAKVQELMERDWPVEFQMEIYLNIGKAHALAGNAQAATAAFSRMLELDEQNAEARANLAALNVQNGNLDSARLFTSELLELTQNDVGALNVLALIAKDQGDMQLAEYLWEKALGEIENAVLSLDDETQFEGLSDEQVVALRRYNESRANRMVKLQGDIENELGIVAFQDDEHDLAESLFRRAIMNNSTNAAARTNLGTIYLEYAFWGRACEQFGEALALRPRDRSAMVGFAACSYGGGDVESAYAAYLGAHDTHSGDSFITEQLMDISFRENNDLDNTERWCGENLRQRSLTNDTCNAQEDNVCALCRSVPQLRNSQQPAAPSDDE